ncbi:class C sortase [Corynebacterium glutamicum]|uniref:class C sortase n=1 Tax=Corynebacterium glutamicum TaxID=1718 RepID=UPI000B2E99FE|nr:class C sortase [Corynebacterium glutamicum]
MSPEYNDYLTQLSDGNAMGQLVIPTIDVNLPMYHGTDEETLEKGIGHLYGTSLPVGGQSTHSVLTGHTGIVSATILNRLDEVELGESIYIRTVGQDLKYEVSDIRVVLPEETDSLRIVEGEDLLTVITCTPYGINSHRLLVTGHRVPMDPNEAAVFEEAGSKLDWWMLVVAGAVIMVFIVIFVRSRKKSTRKFEQETIR